MPSLHYAHPGPALVRVLDEEASALQGFPVRPLIQHWLTPKSRAPSRPDSSAGRLLQQVMQCWVAELARQLTTMPAGGSVALEQVRQRTRASHDALVRLLALVGPILADTGAASQRTSRFVPVIAPASVLPPVESDSPRPERNLPRRSTQPLHA